MTFIERLKENINEINSSLSGTYLNKIQCLSDYDYLFSFSKSKSKGIFISLNVKNPFLKLTDKKFLFNQSNAFFLRLKGKLLNSLFLKASIYNDDNILELEFIKTTDTYDKIHYSLIFEIFKSNSNLILLVDKKVDEAFRFKGIDTHHPVLRNGIYEAPTKAQFSKEISEKDLLAEESYFENIEKLHLAQKYKEINLELKRRKKSLEKKLEKIKEDQVEAKEKLKYKDYADYLLTILSEVKRGDEYFVYEDQKIKLNESYSPSQNLERFYKIYKKAKSTIVSTDEYIQKTEDEIEYLSLVISNLPLFNEDDYEEIIQELINKKILKVSHYKKPKNIKNAAKPYYIMFNDTKIGFGKNSLQNDNLTFKYASKDDYFIHLKNIHSNHLIVFKKDLDDKTLEFALEFALFLSGKKDAEIILAKVKTIKKGKEPGLVLLTNYESYFIKEFHYDFNKYLKNVSRF